VTAIFTAAGTCANVESLVAPIKVANDTRSAPEGSGGVPIGHHLVMMRARRLARLNA